MVHAGGPGLSSCGLSMPRVSLFLPLPPARLSSVCVAAHPSRPLTQVGLEQRSGADPAGVTEVFPGKSKQTDEEGETVAGMCAL